MKMIICEGMDTKITLNGCIPTNTLTYQSILQPVSYFTPLTLTMQETTKVVRLVCQRSQNKSSDIKLLASGALFSQSSIHFVQKYIFKISSWVSTIDSTEELSLTTLKRYSFKHYNCYAITQMHPGSSCNKNLDGTHPNTKFA